MAVTPHAIVQQNFIKSINATKPDTSGNVSITRVNSAASADDTTRAYNLRVTSHTDHFVVCEWDNSFFWKWVKAPDGGYRCIRVERANSTGYADSAGTAGYASRSANDGSFFINGYEVSVG